MLRVRQIKSSKFLKSKNWRCLQGREKIKQTTRKERCLDLCIGEDLWITGHV